MRTSKFHIAILCCLIILGGTVTRSRLEAQTGGGTPVKSATADPSKSQNLMIVSIEGLETEGLVLPPEYKFGNYPVAPSKVKEWGQIRVVYKTAPEWIDQLEFKYHILLKTEDKKAKAPFSLLEGMVSYIDVQQGNDHVSTVFLRPNTLKRYGMIVAAGVEISYENETVRKWVISKTVPIKGDEWWTGIKGHAEVVVRSGYVLNRSQTPFALVNYGSFETIAQ